jgi:hypothetical protein
LEDLAGWALFNQRKPAEAVVRLKRAISVLPDTTGSWRTAMWHLGTAQDAAGNGADALNTYYQIYRAGPPDASRRIIIEALYRRVNGSLDGLDDKIGPVEQPAPASGTEPVSLGSFPRRSEPTASSTPPATLPVTDGRGGNGDVGSGTGEPAETPKAEPTPAITMTLPRDMPPASKPASDPATGSAAPTDPSTSVPKPEPTPESTAPAVTEPKASATTEPTPVPTPREEEREPPVTTGPAPVPTPAPISQPPVDAPAAAPAADKKTPAPDEAAKTTTLPMPSENSGSTDAAGRERTESRPRVALVDAASASEATASPADVYRALFTAVHGNDVNAIEHLLSQATIDYAADQARTDQKTLAQVIGNGMTFTTAAREMPELGEERVGETTAILKVRNYALDRWEELPFVKENGRWKLGIGDLNRGAFKAPASETATTEPEVKTPPVASPTNSPATAPAPGTDRSVCAATLSETELSVLNNGGTATVTVSLEGDTAIDKISAATPNWADIAVFPQSGLRSDVTGRVFVINSISRNTGVFTVIFKTPCGTKEVKVTVR